MLTKPLWRGGVNLRLEKWWPICLPDVQPLLKEGTQSSRDRSGSQMKDKFLVLFFTSRDKCAQ